MDKCPNVELLEALAKDRLTGQQRLELESHVDTCGLCQSRLQQKMKLPADTVAAIETSATETKSIQEDVSGREFSLEQTCDAHQSESNNVRAIGGSDGSLRRVDLAHLKLDDYELQSEIARGGMGVVYKAWDTGLKCSVALKTIRAGEFAGEEHVERFQREAEATAKLQHPGIVRIHRVGKAAGLHYFTMDLIEGPCLADMIKDQPLPESDATRLTIEICDAIEYAHQCGVLHRDLKPSNVLIDSSGRALVTDFGLAKQLGDESDFSRSGQALGTPSYMPPEQAVGSRDQIGFQSDVYSIGALLYHLLAGRPPFVGESHHQVLDQVLHAEPTPLKKINPKISRDLNTICLKCLQKDRSLRYVSAAALRDDLRRFEQGFPIQARPTSLFERGWRLCRRNRTVAGLLLAMLLTICVAGAVTTHRNKQISANFAARLDAAQQRLDSEIDRAKLTKEMSHDDLLPSRVGMDVDKLQEALNHYDEVLGAWQAYHGEGVMDQHRTAQVADALYRVGQASRLLGDFDRSESALQLAIERFDHLVTQSSEQVQYASMLGESLDYLGELYREHDRIEDANRAYQRSLYVLSNLQRRFPRSPEATAEFARVQNNYALLLEERGSMDEARQRFLQSETILRQLLDGQSNHVANRRDWARTLINIGRLDRIQGANDAASKRYESAISELKKLHAEDPRNRRLEFLLAVTERNLGFLLLEKLHDAAAAQTWLESARRRFEHLPSDISEYRFNYGICLVNLTSLHGQSGGVDGINVSKEFFEQSLQVLSELIVLYPDIAEYQSWMGIILGNGAALAQADNDVELAISRIDSAISHQRRAHEKQPQNPEYEERLSNHLRFKNAIKPDEAGD